MTSPVLSKQTENGRYYTRPGTGQEAPSITNVIGKKYKPLYRAGMREVATYASQNVARLGQLTSDEAFAVLMSPPKPDHSPSVIGDIVHGLIERYVKGDAPTQEEIMASHNTVKWMYGSWLKFVERYQPQFTGSEFTVWSDKYGYAGTADLSFNLATPDGLVHVLADAKTGKAIYPEVGMQLAAIANADVILDAEGREFPVPHYDRYAALHIRPRSATLHPVYKIPEAFEAFLALKRVFDWDVTHANQTVGFAPKVN